MTIAGPCVHANTSSRLDLACPLSTTPSTSYANILPKYVIEIKCIVIAIEVIFSNLVTLWFNFVYATMGKCDLSNDINS